MKIYIPFSDESNTKLDLGDGYIEDAKELDFTESELVMYLKGHPTLAVQEWFGYLVIMPRE